MRFCRRVEAFSPESTVSTARVSSVPSSCAAPANLRRAAARAALLATAVSSQHSLQVRWNLRLLLCWPHLDTIANIGPFFSNCRVIDLGISIKGVGVPQLCLLLALPLLCQAPPVQLSRVRSLHQLCKAVCVASAATEKGWSHENWCTCRLRSSVVADPRNTAPGGGSRHLMMECSSGWWEASRAMVCALERTDSNAAAGSARLPSSRIAMGFWPPAPPPPPMVPPRRAHTRRSPSFTLLASSVTLCVIGQKLTASMCNKKPYNGSGGKAERAGHPLGMTCPRAQCLNTATPVPLPASPCLPPQWPSALPQFHCRPPVQMRLKC